MRKIVIFGTTEFSHELCYYVEHDGQDEVAAYVLDQKYVQESRFEGKKVVAYEELPSIFAKDEIEILISLGYSQMNRNRQGIFERCKQDGWRIGSYIHSSAQNLASSIGEGNLIMDKADLRFHSVIGDGNIILTKTVIAHECTIGNFNYFAGSNHICGCSKIGNRNFFGTNCVLTHQTKIGNSNMIGAGVCLGRSLEDHMVAASAAVRVRPMNERSMDLMLMNEMKG